MKNKPTKIIVKSCTISTQERGAGVIINNKYNLIFPSSEQAFELRNKIKRSCIIFSTSQA